MRFNFLWFYYKNRTRGGRKRGRRVSEKGEERMGAGERMKDFETVLIHRDLYCGNSEESVSGDGNNNSAHCKEWQGRSWEHMGLQCLGPVFLFGLLENTLLSIHGRSWLPGCEFGFVALHSLFLQKLQRGETGNTVGVGRAEQVCVRQEGPVQAAPLGIAQQGCPGPLGRERLCAADLKVLGQLNGALSIIPVNCFQSICTSHILILSHTQHLLFWLQEKVLTLLIQNIQAVWD